MRCLNGFRVAPGRLRIFIHFETVRGKEYSETLWLAATNIRQRRCVVSVHAIKRTSIMQAGGLRVLSTVSIPYGLANSIHSIRFFDSTGMRE